MLQEVAIGDNFEVRVVDAIAGLHHNAFALVAAQGLAFGEGEGGIHRWEFVEKRKVRLENLDVRDVEAGAEFAALGGRKETLLGDDPDAEYVELEVCVAVAVGVDAGADEFALQSEFLLRCLEVRLELGLDSVFGGDLPEGGDLAVGFGALEA